MVSYNSITIQKALKGNQLKIDFIVTFHFISNHYFAHLIRRIKEKDSKIKFVFFCVFT